MDNGYRKAFKSGIIAFALSFTGVFFLELIIREKSVYISFLEGLLCSVPLALVWFLTSLPGIEKKKDEDEFDLNEYLKNLNKN